MQLAPRSPRTLYPRSSRHHSVAVSEAGGGALQRSQISSAATQQGAALAKAGKHFTMQEHTETVREMWIRHTKAHF